MSVYRRGKTWSWSIEVGQDGDGRRKKVYGHGFPTKKAATAAKQDAATAMRGGTFVDPTTLTVEAYLIGTWLPFKQPALLRRDKPATPTEVERPQGGEVAATTYSAYRTAVIKHIVPACGRIPLQQLRPVHVEHVLRGLADEGMSRKTQLNVLGVLNKAMKDALRWELIVRNPCEGVEKPTAEKPPITTWTLAEVRQFLTALEGHEHAAAFLLLVTTGIRRGELAGLTWPYVDLEAGRIRIARVLTYSGGKRVWKEPKTRAGERTVALDAGTVAALRAWKVEQAQQRLAAGPVWSTVSVDDFGQGVEGVVFTHPDGSAIAPNRWGTWLRKICADAGLRPISPHDIRHTAATHGLAMAASMQDMKTLSARLGHASIAFTVDRYADALAEQDQRLADGLAQLYGGTASLEEHRQQRDGGAHEDTAEG